MNAPKTRTPTPVVVDKDVIADVCRGTIQALADSMLRATFSKPRPRAEDAGRFIGDMAKMQARTVLAAFGVEDERQVTVLAALWMSEAEILASAIIRKLEANCTEAEIESAFAQNPKAN